MPYEEMLKHLLDEFTENETLAAEELKIVREQIHELSIKLEHLEQKLAVITQDHEKVVSMASRYVDASYKTLSDRDRDDGPIFKVDESKSSGIFSLLNRKKSENIQSTAEAYQENITTYSAELQSTELQETASTNEPNEIASISSTKSEATLAVPDKETSAESHTRNLIDLGSTEQPAEETDNDTVKSINEALRGLFR